MKNLKIALINIFDQDANKLADFASEFGFKGIDWSLNLNLDESDFLRKMDTLKGFEIRFHCPWPLIDIAYADYRAEQAMQLFGPWIDLISKAGGQYLTVHIGLGQSSVTELDWEKAIENLSRLVSFGAEHGITVCLENITTGWTSNPKLFKTLVKKTGAGVTLDIGHINACRSEKPSEKLFELYVMPNKRRIFNAHIYYTEIPEHGHVAPERLDQILDYLWLLRSATSCDWWVIELSNPEEILKTKDFMTKFLCSYEKKS